MRPKAERAIDLQAMSARRIIVLVHDFLCRNFNARIAKHLSLDGDLLIRWHGIGNRTVSKTREYDLGIVEEFAPNVVIMQLGTNDLTTISAVETGSAIEDLCRLLYESYGEELICVCQTLYRQDASSFNKQVDLLTKNPFLMYFTGVTEGFSVVNHVFLPGMVLI